MTCYYPCGMQDDVKRPCKRPWEKASRPEGLETIYPEADLPPTRAASSPASGLSHQLGNFQLKASFECVSSESIPGINGPPPDQNLLLTNLCCCNRERENPYVPVSFYIRHSSVRSRPMLRIAAC